MSAASTKVGRQSSWHQRPSSVSVKFRSLTHEFPEDFFTYVVQLNEKLRGEEEYRNFYISKRNRIHTGSLKKMVTK